MVKYETNDRKNVASEIEILDYNKYRGGYLNR